MPNTSNETKQLTVAVFVDLTAAYDVDNHRALLLKIAKTIKNAKVVRIIKSPQTAEDSMVKLMVKAVEETYE